MAKKRLRPLFNEKLDTLCKNIAIEAIKEKSAVALLHGVDPCRAPQGCESMQYGCRAQQCKYDGTKDRWPNDASSHFSRKR